MYGKRVCNRTNFTGNYRTYTIKSIYWPIQRELNHLFDTKMNKNKVNDEGNEDSG